MQNSNIKIVTSGKWGDHVGASGRYLDESGNRIPEAAHFKRIMEDLGARVDIMEGLSKNSGENILLNSPTPPTDIAPAVSP